MLLRKRLFNSAGLRHKLIEKYFTGAVEKESIKAGDIKRFLKEYGGNTLSHLIYMQDKLIFWTQDMTVFIMYRKIGFHLIVLGDPIGKEENIKEGLKEFHDYCCAKHLTPVFYQIHPKYMSYYHDAGFRFVKVGEEAIVNLSMFTLEGKKGAKWRTIKNKFERSNFTCRVVNPPYGDALLEELQKLSDEWLGTRKEKGFSVSSFNKDYVSLFPLVLLYNKEGQIEGFASLANDEGKCVKTITIDLMRQRPGSPNGTMDILFISAFLWAKEKGYEWFSLGMAPLANVGESRDCFISEKIGKRIFQHGNKFYKFKGLKEYKSKYSPQWVPKYLAYKKMPLVIVLFHVILAIHVKSGTKKHKRFQSRHLLKRKAG